MLNYRVQGNGQPLVLLHGFVGGAGYWFQQEEALGDKFQLISIDLPGFAGSAGEPEQDSLEGYANTVIEVMDGLDLPRVSLLGFSMGGMIA